MKKEKKIPIGVSDFREVIIENGFYVDKTMLIHEIFKNTLIKVRLFTRPRRFGKTLNLSMIKHFFDFKTAEENRKLFEGLNIEKTETMKFFGQYSVIFLTFKDIKSKTSKGNLQIVKEMISKIYLQNIVLKEILIGFELKEFEAILNGEEANYSMALKNLMDYLYRYYKKEVIVLIDEYDTPLIEGYVNGYYDEIIDFYRNLYQSMLKDVKYLKIGILTGINRVAKENIFSGLNNVNVNSVLTEEFEECFGFTEKEVKDALIEYKLENTFNDVKYWYNGYNFNNTEIYNPWSIVNYLYDKKLKQNWINSSENILISRALKNVASREVFEKLDVLFDGGSIKVRINENTTFKDLKRPSELWNLMLNSGYLTVESNIDYINYRVKIPNYEIEKFFLDVFKNEIIEDEGEHFFECAEALIRGDLEEFRKQLKENVFNSVSFSEKDKESFYHGYMTMFASILKKTHYTKSEREAGYGKLDLYLEPKNKEKNGYIIEIKYIKDLKNEKKLNEKMILETKKALKQIKENKYYMELVERNIQNIFIISIVFLGKRVEIDFEKISK